MKCKCGSTDLFSGYFDREGYAFPVNIGDPTPPGVKYETRCNSCGEVVKPPKQKKRP